MTGFKFECGLNGTGTDSSDGNLTARLSVWNPEGFPFGDVTVTVYTTAGRHVGSRTEYNVKMTDGDRQNAANRLIPIVLKHHWPLGKRS